MPFKKEYTALFSSNNKTFFSVDIPLFVDPIDKLPLVVQLSPEAKKALKQKYFLDKLLTTEIKEGFTPDELRKVYEQFVQDVLKPLVEDM